MKKLKLLLLDANVIIALHELGLWKRVVEYCNIHVSGTIIDEEANFFLDEEGNHRAIDLTTDVINGLITRFDMPVSEVDAFKRKFRPTYFDSLDPGEAESLTYLMSSVESYSICSSDKIVFRVLGAYCRSDQGISLEEVLQLLGLGCRLGHEYTKRYRERWAGEGFREGLQGIA